MSTKLSELKFTCYFNACHLISGGGSTESQYFSKSRSNTMTTILK